MNIKESNFVTFCPVQRKLTYQPKLVIFDNELNKKMGSGAQRLCQISRDFN